MHLTPRASASSGWLPAALLGLAAVVVLTAYGTPIQATVLFTTYLILGVTVPGTLWVRFLRGGPRHIAEDLALGLLLGYAVEIATYLVARAIDAPYLFLVWPIATIAGFLAIPRLRVYWRGDGTRAPIWWSWSLAAMLAFLLAFSAVTFFGSHPLLGGATPYLDMTYHLALVGELRHHVPPAIPYVIDVPLAYHWFFYADAAATSWATGIEPITLLYRLSLLPMFVAFVVLTASAARRLSTGWWTGPLAVAIALFGTVAGPHGWTAGPVFDSETLNVTWISPTNMFGLAIFAGVLLTFIDALRDDAVVTRRSWLLIAILVATAAGAKASILPVLIVGLLVVAIGVGVQRRRLDRTVAIGLALAAAGLILATILLFRGTTGGLTIGFESLRSQLVVRLAGPEGGLTRVILPLTGLAVGLVLWSLLWAGVFGLLGHRRWIEDRRILLLLGVCAGAIGAAVLFNYPGGSQIYFLKGAAGAFGLLAATGIAALVPARARYGPLAGCVALAMVAGALIVTLLRRLGPISAPSLADDRLPGVLLGMVTPVAALVVVAIIAYLVLRRAERSRPVLRGAVPLLVVVLVMGFSLPNAVRVATPSPSDRKVDTAVPGDGIEVARWLRDHTDPGDLVATNLHCRPPSDLPAAGCDARHFWVSGYAERHMLVEGWAYTAPAIASAMKLHVSDRTVPFWDQPLLAANDRVFSAPSSDAIAAIRDGYGVRWLFADLSAADGDAIGRVADLRYRVGDYAVFEVRPAA